MRSFPWDSVATSIGEDGYPVYDRVYQASDLREVYETFFSNGVFMPEGEPSFAVSPGEDMTVTVAPGKCHVLGTVGYEPEQRTLALTASSNQNDRIDTVVLRWDSSIDARSIDLYVVAGSPGENPVRPQLTRSETVWELGLCDVFVPKSSLTVTADRITDTRLDNDRCGVVEPFDTVDTTSLYSQLQAAVSRAVELADAALSDSIAGQLKALIDDIPNKEHPVGSYYFSDDPTSPASLFGGEWEKLDGVFIRAGNRVETGGSDTVTLSVSNIPSHTHTGPSHTHTIEHTHSVPNHTHALNGSGAAASSSGSHTHELRTTDGHYLRFYTTDAQNGSKWSFATRDTSNSGGIDGMKTSNTAGAHTHALTGYTASGGAIADLGSMNSSNSGSSGAGATGATGGGTAFSVVPRYRSTNVWLRVA